MLVCGVVYNKITSALHIYLHIILHVSTYQSVIFRSNMFKWIKYIKSGKNYQIFMLVFGVVYKKINYILQHYILIYT